MKSAWCFSPLKPRSANSFLLAALLLAGAAALATPARAGAPDWLRAVARAPVPSFPPETNAVILFDEQITTVTDKGEIKTVYRRAYKILRPQGRERGNVVVVYDDETRLTFLKAWAIPAEGKEYEVKEKDAVETSPFSGFLYADTRAKILKIPAADPGNVIGYEYERKRRPSILQDMWWFQEDLPVVAARFVLRLPEGWEYQNVWLNHPPSEPRAAGENQWVWEVNNVSAVEEEPSMPHLRAVSGRMAVTFFPREGDAQDKSHSSWREVGLWYSHVASASRQSSEEIRQKVAELTAGAKSTLEKMQRLAAFTQRDIRYVAIEIGTGGYQPHPAPDIFTNRYGDCKDKVTLLSTMLGEIGIDSYYVLLHSDRGAVAPDFPSMMNFNHVILAIRLPQDVSVNSLYAVEDHPRLGQLLYFDPTDNITRLGYLPASEQASYGLLVTEDGGELRRLPLLPPSTNRLTRSAKFSVSPTGALSGEVDEIRWGSPATYRRAQLLDSPTTDRQKVLEDFLSSFLPGFRLTGASVQNLESYDQNLLMKYRFVARNYAQSVGDLLLLRLRVLGEKGSSVLERKPRKYPVEFNDAELHTDAFEFVLPEGYRVDELPAPVEVSYPFAEYHSRVEVEGNVLRYTRTYQIKDVRVSVDRLADLKKFYGAVAADERASAVLKRINQ